MATAGETCSRRVVLAHPEESLTEAARRMLDQHVGCLVVVDAVERPAPVPIGILTDRDIVVRSVARGRRGLDTVGAVMTANPVTARQDEPIETVIQRMRSSGVKRMPIVNAAGGLEGIVSFDDLLAFVQRELSALSSLSERERFQEYEEEEPDLVWPGRPPRAGAKPGSSAPARARAHEVRLPYADRHEAGEVLARALADRVGGPELLVLALPRGGVPVAYEVARALGAPLDVVAARKLRLPDRPELSIGAIASGGARVENRSAIASLRLGEDEVLRIVRNAAAELERSERELRGRRGAPKLEGRRVLLIDDGLATGSTMRAALYAVRAAGAQEVILAVPVAPARSLDSLRTEVSDLICPAVVDPFFSLAQFYDDFSEITVEHARDLLERAWRTGLEPARAK